MYKFNEYMGLDYSHPVDSHDQGRPGQLAKGGPNMGAAPTRHTRAPD
jgi:hypothetical protein